jgi:hypothetical protein
MSGVEGSWIAVADPTEPDEALTKEEPWPSPIMPWLYPSRRQHHPYAALLTGMAAPTAGPVTKSVEMDASRGRRSRLAENIGRGILRGPFRRFLRHAN